MNEFYNESEQASDKNIRPANAVVDRQIYHSTFFFIEHGLDWHTLQIHCPHRNNKKRLTPNRFHAAYR